MLKHRRRWVPWRPELRPGQDKPTKVPYRAADLSQRASTTDADTWATFEQATRAVSGSGGKYGIGYVFDTDDGSSGVDLDNCRDPATGELEPWAKEIIELLASYTEISPSGTGIKVFVLGHKPDGRSRRGNVEMYSEARFFTVTGDHLPGTPTTLEERSGQLAQVYGMHLADPPEEEPRRQPAPSDVADKVIIDRAMRARNGAKFAALWRGDTAGYESHSEADAALAAILWFHTGDRARVDALFRESGLWRPKWDERRHGDGRSYGEGTLDLACQGKTHEYKARGVISDNGASPDLPEGADHLTDLGNAKRLVAQHGRDFHYVYAFKLFLIWANTHWLVDDAGHIAGLAKATVMSLYQEAAALYQQSADAKAIADKASADTLSSKAKETWKWAKQSESAPRIAAMLELVKSEPGVPVSPSQLDADPWLLNVQNGTIHLRNGELRPHRREDLISKLAPVEYDPLDLWDRFLNEAIPDEPTRNYVQRVAGASLAGVQTDDLLIFVHGPGGTGKSTLREALLLAH